MTRTTAAVLAVLAGAVGAAPLPPDQLTGPQPWVTTALKIDGNNVPQLVFDGDNDTWFRSAEAPAQDTTVTLSFSAPVTLAALSVATGDADGKGKLAAGVLEASVDGQAFEKAADFAEGSAKAETVDKPVKAVRLRATAAGNEPLVVREFTFRSTPLVPRFVYPLEIVLDVKVDELKTWAEEVRVLGMTWYPFLAELMTSDGFKPARRIDLAVVDANGIAWTSGTHITCTKGWFTKHLDDKGAVIHEISHVLQAYRRYDPGWLVEGIADWVRWWNYEPVAKRPHVGVGGSYKEAYQRTGQFLDWVDRHRAPGLTMKLNAALRRGDYKPEMWARYTGLDVDALWAEYQAELKAKR